MLKCLLSGPRKSHDRRVNKNNLGKEMAGDLCPLRRPLKILAPAGPSEQASGSQCQSNQNWWMWVCFNLAMLNWLEGRLCFEVENSISFRRSDPTSPGKPSHTHTHTHSFPPPPKGKCRSPFQQKTENIFLKSIRMREILSLSWLSGQWRGILTNFKGSPLLWSSQIRQLAVKGSQTEEKNWAKSQWKEESQPPSGLTTNSFSSHTQANRQNRLLHATNQTVPDVTKHLFSFLYKPSQNIFMLKYLYV